MPLGARVSIVRSILRCDVSVAPQINLSVPSRAAARAGVYRAVRAIKARKEEDDDDVEIDVSQNNAADASL
jgi:hypothetical protein